MASEIKESPAGRHIHHDGSIDVRSSKAATLAHAAAPLLDLGPDTVSHGSAEDIPMNHDSRVTQVHRRGIRKAMFKVKDVVKKPFKAMFKSKHCQCHTIHQNNDSSRAELESNVIQPLHGKSAPFWCPTTYDLCSTANASYSSTNTIKPDDGSFTTKPKARTFSTSTKKVAKKAGPALLALAIGIAEHYLNNAGF